MASELERASRQHGGRRGKPPVRLVGEEARGAAGIEHALDVAVARATRVVQDLAGTGLVEDRRLVAQPVDRLPERRPPGLAPAGRARDPAAAVRSPALHPVRAAPRRPLDDLHLVRRRMRVAEGRRADQLDLAIFAQHPQRGRERHLAEAVMMAVGLAVDRDGDDAPIIVQRRTQPLGELDAVAQERTECDAVRQRRVTEEHVDEAAAGQEAAVEAADVERLRRDRRPGRVVRAQRPDATGLVRREQGERDAGLRQRREGRAVDRHLGQPHPLRRAPEAVLEVSPPPPDLRAHVARRRERQDRVPVGRRPRIAVTGARLARHVGPPEGGEHLGRMRLEPGEQRRTEVEARPLVAVDQVTEPPRAVEHPRLGVRRVALARDARVPVAVRRGRRLGADHAQPRVLARRLVEVTVQTERAHGWVFRRHSGGMVKRRTNPPGSNAC